MSSFEMLNAFMTGKVIDFPKHGLTGVITGINLESGIHDGYARHFNVTVFDQKKGEHTIYVYTTG